MPSRLYNFPSPIAICMRNEIFPAILVNKDVTVISNYSLQSEPVNPEETQEGKEYLPSSNHQTAATPHSKP